MLTTTAGPQARSRAATQAAVPGAFKLSTNTARTTIPRARNAPANA